MGYKCVTLTLRNKADKLCRQEIMWITHPAFTYRDLSYINSEFNILRQTIVKIIFKPTFKDIISEVSHEK